jgi:hypothetical protein
MLARRFYCLSHHSLPGCCGFFGFVFLFFLFLEKKPRNLGPSTC